MNQRGRGTGKDPLTEIVDSHADALTGAIDNLFQEAWNHRVELSWAAVSVGALAGVYLASQGHLLVLLVVFLVALWAHRHLKRSGRHPHLMRKSLDASRIRRRWDRAIDHCGFSHAIPISRIRRTDEGFAARLRVGWGISLRDLQLQKERLAASMGIGELMIDRDPHNAATGDATLTIIVQDNYLEIAEKQRPPLPSPPKEFR